MLTTILFSGTAALFLTMTGAALIHQRRARRLPALSALPATRSLDGSGAGPVRCSVVVAARDEDTRVEGTVRHLLAQQDVAVEVIVVDDRSTDRTGDVLRRLASEDARVRVTRVEVLPDGWLGKCHACHVGASAATGEWILFTDADWASWISGVNRDRAGAHLGIGAFNLVRVSAYRDCGGYEALRLTIVDDVKLGLLLHRAGKRTRAFIGGDDMQCHWGTTVPAMIKIMEKNYFAAVDFRLAPVVAAGVIGTLMWSAAVIGPWIGTPAGIAAGLAPWTLILPAAVFARRLGWSFGAAAMTPLLYPLLVYAVLNSASVTLRQGGVRWRETFYPLETLRKATVR